MHERTSRAPDAQQEARISTTTAPVYGNQEVRSRDVQWMREMLTTCTQVSWTGCNARVVAASEIRRFTAQNSVADIIRKLYLPPDVPRWQQVVRSAVLIVGTIEEWVRMPPQRFMAVVCLKHTVIGQRARSKRYRHHNSRLW